MGENTDNGMFFFISENGEFKSLGEIKSIKISIDNPQKCECELNYLVNAAESFSATMNVSEESESALWATCEGLEITDE